MSDPTTRDDEPLFAEEAPELPSVGLGPHFEMHPVVFPAGALIVLALVSLAFLLPSEDLGGAFSGAVSWIGSTFGWLYVASLTGFLGFAIWLATGKYGGIRLGRDDEKPEFNRVTWFAMLFSAGMGIGLVFWSVAEPVQHYLHQPPGFADGLNETRLSMAVTIFHWGLHPWALYAVVALALAYFGFRRGMPLGFRSLLHPIFGERVWGRLGDAVDTLAIIATLTGVATSLGLGAQQVNAGLGFLFGVPMATSTQILLIAGITAVATVSVVLGLGTGIRRLSEANMILAGCLMVLVILVSGVVAFLGSTIENTGAYLQLLPFSAFRTGASSAEGSDWLSSWTVFYWAWWISWSPFVGMFIARISRGRTIREFVTGTLLVPTLVGIVWLTAFGATTLHQHTQHVRQTEAYAAGTLEADPNASLREFAVELDPGAESPEVVERPMTTVEYYDAPITNAQTGETLTYNDRVATVLFVLLENLIDNDALVTVAIGIATLCIILFFVTSSDSASMVIDIIASGGNPDPPVGTRLFWAIAEGVVASALLVAGGLKALQAASITAALPFIFILLLSCVALVKALRQERLN